jgi:arginyl-tRNA synthetase
VHARIASIRRKAAENGLGDDEASDASLARLNSAADVALIKHLVRYPAAVASAARQMEPHRITFYLMNLAGAFHSYYNKQRVLVDDPVTSHGRLYLVAAVQAVIRNGLRLLGVSAPERM